MELKVKRIHDSAKLPSYGHKGDAGLDLYSSINCVLARGEIAPIATGIQVEIPVGYVGLVWDKSGISLSGVHRLAGVIDAGYRGEVKVVMANLGETDFSVEVGMKIAQLLIQPIVEVNVVNADELEETARGENGFGSTGKF
ncbi:dUTP diphosphatase [Acidobacteriota bacterium]